MSKDQVIAQKGLMGFHVVPSLGSHSTCPHTVIIESKKSLDRKIDIASLGKGRNAIVSRYCY